MTTLGKNLSKLVSQNHVNLAKNLQLPNSSSRVPLPRQTSCQMLSFPYQKLCKTRLKQRKKGNLLDFGSTPLTTILGVFFNFLVQKKTTVPPESYSEFKCRTSTKLFAWLFPGLCVWLDIFYLFQSMQERLSVAFQGPENILTEKIFASLYSEHPDIVNKTLLLEGVHYIRSLLQQGNVLLLVLDSGNVPKQSVNPQHPSNK